MAFIFAEIEQFFGAFSKRGRFFFGFLGLVILALIAGITNPDINLDYPTYSSYYNATGATGSMYFEKGYSILGLIAYRLGLDYSTFRLIFCLAIAVVLSIGVWRFTHNLSLFGLVYGSTIFIEDTVQVRNWAMIAVVILGMSFLINPTTKNKWIAFFLILFAAQLQSVGYFFFVALILELVPSDKKSATYTTFGMISIVLFLGTLISRSFFIEMVSKLAGFVVQRENIEWRLATRYGASSSHTYLYVMFVTMIVFCCAFAMKQELLRQKDTELSRKIGILYSGFFVSLVAFPFLVLAPDYSRVPRNAFLFFIIEFAIYCSFSKRKNLLIISGFLISCVLVAIVNWYVWGTTFYQAVPYLLFLK